MPGRHLFLTGQPGVGKSTLCQKVLEHAERSGWGPMKGFYTTEVRNADGERCGFDVIALDGARGPLARVGQARGPTVGKYTVDLGSFDRLALPALKFSPGTRLYFIDEIGKMELFCRGFFPAVRALLDNRNVVVFGTVPAAREGRVIPEVAELSARWDVEVVTVTRANRDALVADVCARLQQLLAALEGGGTEQGSALRVEQQLHSPPPQTQRQAVTCSQGGVERDGAGECGGALTAAPPAAAATAAAAAAAAALGGLGVSAAPNPVTAAAGRRPARVQSWSALNASAGAGSAGASAKQPARGAGSRGWATPVKLASAVTYVGTKNTTRDQP